MIFDRPGTQIGQHPYHEIATALKGLAMTRWSLPGYIDLNCTANWDLSGCSLVAEQKEQHVIARSEATQQSPGMIFDHLGTQIGQHPYQEIPTALKGLAMKRWSLPGYIELNCT